MTIADRYGLPVSTGDHAAALAHVEPVDAEIHRMGGRRAQWEVFEETMVVCHLRLERRPFRRDLSWLAEAEAAIAEGARRG